MPPLVCCNRKDNGGLLEFPTLPSFSKIHDIKMHIPELPQLYHCHQTLSKRQSSICPITMTCPSFPSKIISVSSLVFTHILPTPHGSRSVGSWGRLDPELHTSWPSIDSESKTQQFLYIDLIQKAMRGGTSYIREWRLAKNS